MRKEMLNSVFTISYDISEESKPERAGFSLPILFKYLFDRHL